MKHNKEVIQELLDKYRGLRKEDLCQINPEYSCVICEKYYSEDNDCQYASIGGACMDHEKLDIDTFAAKYNFKSE
jgi:hypothetical protein